MYYTIHAPIGILIAQKTSNLGLVFLLTIISHFLLDIVPHGDIKTEKWLKIKNYKKRFLIILLADGALSLALVVFIFLKIKPENPWPYLVALFASALPDLLWIPVKFKKIPLLNGYRKFHSSFHHLIKIKITIWAGLLLQIITASVLVCLILLK